MAIPTIKSTYTLDVESVRALESLAQQWKVSKSEVLRRAIRLASSTAYPEKTDPLHALDRLQSSVRERGVDLSGWEQEIDEERRESGKRVRKQIYLTEKQRNELAAISQLQGKRQSELIREALEHFITRSTSRRRQEALRAAAGIWKNREDIPDFDAVRAEWDRV